MNICHIDDLTRSNLVITFQRDFKFVAWLEKALVNIRYHSDKEVISRLINRSAEANSGDLATAISEVRNLIVATGQANKEMKDSYEAAVATVADHYDGIKLKIDNLYARFDKVEDRIAKLEKQLNPDSSDDDNNESEPPTSEDDDKSAAENEG